MKTEKARLIPINLVGIIYNLTERVGTFERKTIRLILKVNLWEHKCKNFPKLQNIKIGNTKFVAG